MPTIDALLRQLDSDSVIRGRQFEALCAWWLRNDPRYALLLRRVWTWNEWPGRDGPDTGIDLVAETTSGDFWAIQCKGYAPSNRVTKREVDAFLSESARPPFAYRLLIASTDLVGSNARRTIERQEMPVGVVLLGDLQESGVTWPCEIHQVDHRPALAPASPHPHQLRALEAVVGGLSDGGRGQLLMACGTGKTLVALWAHERLASDATLVLLPSLSLLAQTLREWAENASDGFSYLAVCSDDTVGDHAVAHTSALGVPTTTNPDDVATFMRRDGRRVIFATYQSSDRVAEGLTRASSRLDLVIADEAHRTAGRTSGTFSTVLDGSSLPASRRLFMTATPRFYTHRLREAASSDGLAVASMDDATTYGPVLFRMGFAQAVSEGLLTDYRVVVVGVTDVEYRRWVQRERLVTTDGVQVSEARSLAGRVALAKAMGEYDLRRVITFHNRVAAARAFADELPETIAWMPEQLRPAGATGADYVSGDMSSGLRYAKLRQLADPIGVDRAVLANAQCLSEGVDVPALDGVAFIEPRRSQVDIVQAVGRVMRRSDDKPLGTILLPVFIEGDVNDPEAAIAASDFSPLWSLIRALRAHDDVLAEQLDELRRELGRTGRQSGRRLPDKIVLDLPVEVPPDFADALVLRVIGESTLAFEEWFGTLMAYSEQFGTVRVPVTHVTPEGRQLGRWVNATRVEYLSGRLSADRVSRLETLPGWVWDTYDEAWAKGLDYLQRFVVDQGHARVPQMHRTEDGFGLGKWVARRRREFSEGNLADERVARLETISGWSWDPAAEDWLATYQALASFADSHGHARPPRGTKTPDGRSLQSWVGTQRRLRARGLLAEDRVALLEELPGWRWESERAATVQRNLANWNAKYEMVRQFAELEGHARVPQAYEFGGERIGAWVSQQRLEYKKGRLPNELALKLEALPGWAWNVKDAEWEEAFAKMAAYAMEHGTSIVPSDYRHPDGTDLRAWAKGQRKIQAGGRLSQDRYERLRALPGWWWFGDVGRGKRVADVITADTRPPRT